jgi:hypothetical protein
MGRAAEGAGYAGSGGGGAAARELGAGAICAARRVRPGRRRPTRPARRRPGRPAAPGLQAAARASAARGHRLEGAPAGPSRTAGGPGTGRPIDHFLDSPHWVRAPPIGFGARTPCRRAQRARAERPGRPCAFACACARAWAAMSLSFSRPQGRAPALQRRGGERERGAQPSHPGACPGRRRGRPRGGPRPPRPSRRRGRRAVRAGAPASVTARRAAGATPATPRHATPRRAAAAGGAGRACAPGARTPAPGRLPSPPPARCARARAGAPAPAGSRRAPPTPRPGPSRRHSSP